MLPAEPPNAEKEAEGAVSGITPATGPRAMGCARDDLDERTVFEGYDPETGESTWYGP
jgi:hypothetical protein